MTEANARKLFKNLREALNSGNWGKKYHNHLDHIIRTYDNGDKYMKNVAIRYAQNLYTDILIPFG